MAKAATEPVETPVSENAAVAAMAKAFTDALNKSNDRHDRKVQPSNMTSTGVSVFRPPNQEDGSASYPELAYHRQPYHNGARIYMDQLTPSEVEEWNTLSRSLAKAGDKRSARNGRWVAEVSKNNADILLLTPVQTEDERLEMNMVPSISFLLREMRDGEQAANPQSILDELNALKAKVAQLEQR